MRSGLGRFEAIEEAPREFDALRGIERVPALEQVLDEFRIGGGNAAPDAGVRQVIETLGLAAVVVDEERPGSEVADRWLRRSSP